MYARTHTLAARMWAALEGEPARLRRLRASGAGALPGCFAVSDFAAAAVASAALAADELRDLAAARPRAAPATVRVDRRLAAAWFSTTLRPLGWQPPPLRDALTGDWRCRDAWVRVHANAPHHRAAACRVLGLRAHADAAHMAAAVSGWDATLLEQEIVTAGGCAAEMRSAAAWREHPQGAALSEQALVESQRLPAPRRAWQPDPGRLLRGLRVLDLTRVLAGPVATRMLAGLGATVLRIDAPAWDEPGVVPEVTRGKLCARLDLKTPRGRERLVELLADADVLVHGLRPGALAGLGLDPQAVDAIRPGLVDVSLDAYGWRGPWATRRGFDSLVQMSCGIAHAGMLATGAQRPRPLPVQALDHATGYLMAAAVLRALAVRLHTGLATRARLSLAASAQLLLEHGGCDAQAPHAELAEEDWLARPEITPWGAARRLRAPWRIGGVATRWDLPAAALGSSPARWPSPAASPAPAGD